MAKYNDCVGCIISLKEKQQHYNKLYLFHMEKWTLSGSHTKCQKQYWGDNDDAHSYALYPHFFASSVIKVKYKYLKTIIRITANPSEVAATFVFMSTTRKTKTCHTLDWGKTHWNQAYHLLQGAYTLEGQGFIMAHAHIGSVCFMK